MIDFEKFEDIENFDPEDISPEEADFLQKHYPELYAQTGYAAVDFLVSTLNECAARMGIIGTKWTLNNTVAEKIEQTFRKVGALAENKGRVRYAKVEWDEPCMGTAQIIYLFEYLDVETADLLEAVKETREIYFDSFDDKYIMMTLVFDNVYNCEIYHLNNQ